MTFEELHDSIDKNMRRITESMNMIFNSRQHLLQVLWQFGGRGPDALGCACEGHDTSWPATGRYRQSGCRNGKREAPQEGEVWRWAQATHAQSLFKLDGKCVCLTSGGAVHGVCAWVL